MLTLKFNEVTVELEHNLISLSKWESVFKRPYLKNQELKAEERLFYYQCMVLNDVNITELLEANQNDPKSITQFIEMIDSYINSSLTGTTILQTKASDGNTMVYTSEVLYAMLAITGLDISAEHWHISRLIMTLNVIGELKAEKKKMPQREIIEQRASLNEERRRKYQSKG